MDQGDLEKIFDTVALLAIDESFPGVTWLTPLCENIWDMDNIPENWYDRYGNLLELLFSISFIGIFEDEHSRVIYSYSHLKEERSRIAALKKAKYFEVHFSFRPILEIK